MTFKELRCTLMRMGALGNKIKQKRRELKLSLFKVCEKVINEETKKPISVSYLNDIEQGYRLKPAGSIVVQIADALGLNRDELLGLADKADPELEKGLKNPKLAELFRMIKDDPEKIKKLLDEDKK